MASDTVLDSQKRTWKRRTYLIDREFQLKYIFMLTLMGAGCVGLFGLVFTHRVAGPVYVMNLYVEALAAGHYPRLRPLRKYDELKKFFDRFSHAVERIRAREAEEAQALSHAMAAFQPLATTEEARAALKALEELLSRKREAVDKR